MKKGLLILIFSAQVFSQDICEFMFRENVNGIYTPDLKNIHKINKLDRWSQRLRAHTYAKDVVPPTPARKALARFEQNEERFLAGKYYEAMGSYKTLFNAVESSALVVERYSKLADALRYAGKDVPKDPYQYLIDFGVTKQIAGQFSNRLQTTKDIARELSRVEKSLRKNYRILGYYYDEYNLVRTQLARLKKKDHCGVLCKETVERFENNVGLASDTQRAFLKDILSGRQDYPLSTVQRIYKSHPEAILMARKKEFLNEGVSLVKMYVNKFRLLNRLLMALSAKSVATHRMVVGLFKSIFDKQFKDIHSVIANRVTHMDAPAAKKYAKVKKELREIDPNKFWINFSRLQEGKYREVFSELERFAKKHEPAVFKEIQVAKEIGAKLGPIGVEKARGSMKALTLLALGGSGWAYLNFTGKDDDTVSGVDIVLPDPKDVEDEEDVSIDYMSEVDEEVEVILHGILEAQEQMLAPEKNL